MFQNDEYTGIGIIGFDEVPPRDYREAEAQPDAITPAQEAAIATFEAELAADAYGPIGSAETCPSAYVTHTYNRAGAKKRLAKSTRREPGNRAIRRVLRRAERAGVTGAITFRAWITHEFSVGVSPDRRDRLVAEFTTGPESLSFGGF